jgi:hypothetical protein
MYTMPPDDEQIRARNIYSLLTLSNPIFPPHTPQHLFILVGKEVGGLLVIILQFLKKNMNRNRKRTTCAICLLKSVLHEEKRREEENRPTL